MNKFFDLTEYLQENYEAGKVIDLNLLYKFRKDWAHMCGC